LDFIRGLAILAVMEYHFMTVPVANPLARAFEFAGKRIGWMGVDFFFVLSGFLVGGLLVQELLKSQAIPGSRPMHASTASSSGLFLAGSSARTAINSMTC
jgi:peptidoglycan/LPS O-acetylase OafA/YrhL